MDKESHTLFIRGEGVSAEIVMHSKEQLVVAYINELKKDPDLEKQRKGKLAEEIYARFGSLKQMVLKAGKSTSKESKINNDQSDEIKEVVDELTEIFRQISGSENDVVYPRNKFESNGNKPEKVSMSYLSDTVQYGSAPKEGGPGVTGWNTIKDMKLTEDPHDGWIQFHLINDNLGGLGEPNNLIPTPNSINKAYQKYESHTHKLIFSTIKRGENDNKEGKKNVVWMEVNVSYYGGEASDFASHVSAKTGIYVYKPDAGVNPEQKWIKEPKDLYSISLQIPSPLLRDKDDADKFKVNLNQSGFKQIKAYFDAKGIDVSSSLVGEIIKNRHYTGLGDLVNKLTAVMKNKDVTSSGKIKDDIDRENMLENIFSLFEDNMESKLSTK